MATVLVNDLTIEPKAPAPRAVAPPPEPGTAPKNTPEMERDLEKLARRMHDRKLRLWPY